MNRTIAATAASVAGAALALTVTSPAAADPKPINDGWQTSVCDNGQTYAFPITHHAADPSASVYHAALLVPDSNVVLQPLSFSGTVSFEVDGAIIASFPVEVNTPRTANPTNTIVCDTTFAVTAENGTIVHVAGTDVFAIAGR